MGDFLLIDSDYRNCHGRLLGIYNSRLGWLLGMGPGRKRFSGTVAVQHSASSRNCGSAKKKDVSQNKPSSCWRSFYNNAMGVILNPIRRFDRFFSAFIWSLWIINLFVNIRGIIHPHFSLSISSKYQTIENREI